MGWQETRADARKVVHATFAGNATYYAPGSVVGVPITVRHHTGMVMQGDLDREGYAEQSEDINRMVFDKSEVTPAYKGRVVLLNGDEFFLETSEKQDGGQFVVWNVLRDRR